MNDPPEFTTASPLRVNERLSLGTFVQTITWVDQDGDAGVSFMLLLAAFLLMSFVSPCIVAYLPAFFSPPGIESGLLVIIIVPLAN